MKFDKFTDKVFAFIDAKFLRNIYEYYDTNNLKFMLPNFVIENSWKHNIYGSTIRVVSGDDLVIDIWEDGDAFERVEHISWEALKIEWRKIIANT